MKPLLCLLLVWLLATSARAADFSAATSLGLAWPALVLPPAAQTAPPDWVFGALEPGFAGRQVSTRLLLWSLPWAGAGLLGLWLAGDDWQRGFWGMSGAWALINAGIALAGLLGNEPQLADLRTILLINAGLDVLYIASGAYLMTRPEAIWRGAGLGVLLQGGFLLAFDLLHALLIQT